MGAVWTLEAEPEVDDWLSTLPTRDVARVRFYLDLLRELGSTLSMPYSRSLGEGLRELRFHLRDEQRRITFWIGPERRIILLTTFRKQRQNEHREVERAKVALRCLQRELTNE